MPRPRKGPGYQRSETFRCRFTPTEYQRLVKAAGQAGLTLSEFVRAVLVNRRVKVTQDVRKFDGELYDHLRRIGVNLNQAVHQFHATGDAPARAHTGRGRRRKGGHEFDRAMIPRVAKPGRSFKGAGAYYLHDKGHRSTDKRVLFTHTENLPTRDPEKALKCMAGPPCTRNS